MIFNGDDRHVAMCSKQRFVVKVLLINPHWNKWHLAIKK